MKRDAFLHKSGAVTELDQENDLPQSNSSGMVIDEKIHRANHAGNLYFGFRGTGKSGWAGQIVRLDTGYARGVIGQSNTVVYLASLGFSK